ncbi:hypothetical protein HYALB_00013281 [Hymenoscyphus albidus]|uniref:Protein kinase domain-containing protein n=1 Tax=Hymenoscyphus albidus TaxID=595503 RepID=A0A9N9LRC6_9HELO|nr:hypothetical protein HYALB_00013281 [Hymenoscyphus albidus]
MSYYLEVLIIELGVGSFGAILKAPLPAFSLAVKLENHGPYIRPNNDANFDSTYQSQILVKAIKDKNRT